MILLPVRRLFTLGLVALLAWTAPSASAQDRPAQGMVWTPPANVRQAERELRDMQAQGITAVRTAPVQNERLLTLADTLGMQFYQDLPIAYLSAQALADTLDHARRQLEAMLDRAQRHPSARHFGVARLSDTRDPSACAYVQQLADHVRRQGPPESRTYYVTAFAAADRCADAVDVVLLDARNAEAPRRQLVAWQAAHPEAPVGLGAMGTWVRRDGRRGLRVPHSPEAQARYFERHLGHLLADTASAAPSVVFVYRWRDAKEPSSDSYGRAYGLYTEDGASRPAAEVVAGFFSDEQTVFAFPAGTPARRAAPWLVLMGWGLIALLAFLYFREPRFRHTLMRYFGAHRFYQEAIGEGREVLVGPSMAFLGGGVLAIGGLGAVFGRCFQEAQSVVWALSALPAPLESSLSALMSQPWSLGVVLAAMYVVSLVLWTVLLVLVGRYGASITTGQALMVVGWPRWPMLFVMVAAMVLSTLAPETGRSLVPSLIVATGGLALWMTGRTLADFMAITKVPGMMAVATVLVSPLLFLFEIGCVLIIRHDVPLAFIWHLLTRT